MLEAEQQVFLLQRLVTVVDRPNTVCASSRRYRLLLPSALAALFGRPLSELDRVAGLHVHAVERGGVESSGVLRSRHRGERGRVDGGLGRRSVSIGDAYPGETDVAARNARTNWEYSSMTDSPVARPRTPATIGERSRDQPAGDRTDLLGPIDDDRLTAFLRRPSAHRYRRHG